MPREDRTGNLPGDGTPRLLSDQENGDQTSLLFPRWQPSLEAEAGNSCSAGASYMGQRGPVTSNRTQFPHRCSVSGVSGWHGGFSYSNFRPLALIHVPKICTHTWPNVGSHILSLTLLLSLWTTAHLQLGESTSTSSMYQATPMNRLSCRLLLIVYYPLLCGHSTCSPTFLYCMCIVFVHVPF